MSTQKKQLYQSLSGELRVASELLRRNIFCSITFGNHKATDIIAFNPDNNKVKIIEVKTTCKEQFLTKFYQNYKSEKDKSPDYWVLYYQDEEDGDHDEFYILTHKEVAKLQAIRNGSIKKTWEERVVKGVDNLLRKDLQEHLNKWDKISL